MINPRLAPILQELKAALIEVYGTRLVDLVLFGSQARGDAMPESDIDVLVVLDGEVNFGEEVRRAGGVAAELSLKHDVVISYFFMSKQRYQHERSPLLLNIHREGMPV